jgi:hypothetical protein
VLLIVLVQEVSDKAQVQLLNDPFSLVVSVTEHNDFHGVNELALHVRGQELRGKMMQL